MINHISFGVQNPEKVANILAELWGGCALPFPPCPGGYVAFAQDGRGTMVECVPAHVQIAPGIGLPPAGDATIDSDTESYEAQFVPDNEPSLHGSVHLNINTPLSVEEVKAIAAREGWRCFVANRGGGLFQLIEFWIEDRFLLEVHTPAMTERYREIANAETLAAYLNIELPQRAAMPAPAAVDVTPAFA